MSQLYSLAAHELRYSFVHLCQRIRGFRTDQVLLYYLLYVTLYLSSLLAQRLQKSNHRQGYTDPEGETGQRTRLSRPLSGQ